MTNKITITAIALLVLVNSVLIYFYLSTSFVDRLNIAVPVETDFINPSKLLIRYEVFLSDTVLRPSYESFVDAMHLGGNERIIDFGSGSGGEAIHIAGKIRNKAGSLTCIDISHTWLEVVKHRLSGYKNVEYLEGDITDMDIADGSYDVIAVRLVLHDIPRAARKSIIKTFYRVLRPGGSVWVYEPVGEDHSIDENEMRSLFRSAGFRERSFTKEFGFTMIPPRTMAMARFEK